MIKSASDAMQVTDTGVRLHVRVTPRARKTQYAGIVVDERGRAALAIRLAAPPVEGAANEALLAFLKSALGLARNQLTLVTGETARAKTVAIAGDGDLIAERINKLVDAADG
ncbi:DUF167 domain-containing protein [Allosphingosinicella vermicomposti]|uniref:DUF167 domain-containing protein n=1 Tax=Allosphingosinicella vermicomposti TaxID=614671 RepID=UPI0018F879B9|nr:DUF167 domain-containing protein [Allosphingosinicella vermicomposti]